MENQNSISLKVSSCSPTEKQKRTNLSKRSSSERGQSLRQRVRRTKTAFGELGHPDGPTVNLDRVSHMITELVEDGKNFIGRAKILDTPNGQIVKSLIDEGARLGVSSRGMGTLKPDKKRAQIVQDDFYLATAADIVADPSAPNAFVEGIMEGVEWIWENGLLKAQDVERAKTNIQKASSKQLEEVKLKEFKNLLSNL